MPTVALHGDGRGITERVGSRKEIFLPETARSVRDGGAVSTRILLVISPLDERSLVDLLQPEPFRVTMARDILEALRVLEQGLPLGVLFASSRDISSPWDLLGTLRLMAEAHQGLHVVVTTPITGEWILPAITRQQTELDLSLHRRKVSAHGHDAGDDEARRVS